MSILNMIKEEQVRGFQQRQDQLRFSADQVPDGHDLLLNHELSEAQERRAAEFDLIDNFIEQAGSPPGFCYCKGVSYHVRAYLQSEYGTQVIYREDIPDGTFYLTVNRVEGT